jgi:LysM repeat protein
MSKRVGVLIASVLVLAMPAVAQAYPIHVVGRGETLTSIAAADGLSEPALAAANGLGWNAEVAVGQIISIPPQGAAKTSSPRTGVSSSGGGESTRPGASAETSYGSGGEASGGSDYTVSFGDTLTGIAAAAGATVNELARLNGLEPDGLLLAGTVLRLPASSSLAGDSAPVSDSATPPSESAATEISLASDPPYPTDERVSGGEVADSAAYHGVPAALAEAIAWQESGFSNDEVSATGAVGVMQIEPSTWRWINAYLTGGETLAPAAASTNVSGGVLLLQHLLAESGGSEADAIADYYQGASSVAKYGMFPSTRQYVSDVLALARDFGG